MIPVLLAAFFCGRYSFTGISNNLVRSGGVQNGSHQHLAGVIVVLLPSRELANGVAYGRSGDLLRIRIVIMGDYLNLVEGYGHVGDAVSERLVVQVRYIPCGELLGIGD